MSKIFDSLNSLERQHKKLALELKDAAFKLVTLIRQQAEGELVQSETLDKKQTAFAEVLNQAQKAQPALKGLLSASLRQAAIELVEATIIK